MTFNFNIFRILADVSHTASKLILLWAIHSNRSAEGVSLITQILYICVFSTRYLDLFFTSVTRDWHHMWNFFLKIFYISSSAYIVYIMMRVFARTREREKAWKLGAYSFLGSFAAAPLVYLIFKKIYDYPGQSTILQILWSFSEILEATCILPQLLLLRQTTVPTVIDSFYLVTLGSYRAFYILNWIVRGATEDHYADPISWIFGILQTALYIDFAWVYWTRQRVKLRGGGVVDSDDLSRGWLVGRLVGNRKSTEYDEEHAPALNGDGDARSASNTRSGRSWGPRGISVSADEEISGPGTQDTAEAGDEEREPLADPRAFEDESDEEADLPPLAQAAQAEGVGSGEEWRDDSGK